ncbi:NAD(P)/FAD-dependent oxidoreductase [Nocardia lijiangensis]|uniref:NAD(P)/FAD-dependent oxidoreductase n=1 Tax=Nocardia lijiangensis TaxID=299618 RepID=UPI000A7754EC|nr:FAD-dependent oxidoreductase [Nocardia lijiangensis]
MTGSIDRVVVVGGGIAGVSTVGALRSGGFDGELTLVDAGEFPYDRPPLSKEYLCGERTFEQIALRSPRWYQDEEVRLINLSMVTALRPAEGKVELGDGRLLAADRVVLATGGQAARPPIAGVDSRRVHVLRTADDADRLRRVLVSGSTVLIVGAGLIGAEVASAAVELGCKVVLVEPTSPPLAAALGVEVAAWLHALHADRGITTVAGPVVSCTEVSSGIEVRIGGHAQARVVDAVVLGVGMVPETSLALGAGIEVDRGFLVDSGQVTSNPAVLAVGDPARCRGRDVPRAEHWEAAQLDGQRAAATVLGAAPPVPMAPWFWTDRHHRHVEVVGRMSDAERTVTRGAFGGRAFSVFGLRGDSIVAAVAIDDSIAVRAARRMIDRSMIVDSASLADPAVDLRKLLRG